MRALLVNIKNCLPYLLLITIYFLFVNIEASKDLDNSISIDNEHKKNSIQKSGTNETSKRISIKVIPYKE
tara:strand:- start:616 stop:825 length:210 start_codon:yes stop_codon:yes gene_type:complete